MKIEFIHSKQCEKILKVNNIYLNSVYNAKKEAKVLIDGYKNLLNEDIIHVIGLGMGYHIADLLDRVKENQIIKIYCTNKYIYNKVKNEQQIINILKKKNVKIYNSNNINKFCQTLDLSSDIIINKPLLKVCLDEDIKRVIDNFVISKFGINRFKEIMDENKINNTNIKCNNINYFFKIPSKKIKLIVSSGPSLDLLINSIKEYRDNYDIYVVGSALSTLMKNNIKPTAIIIIDSEDIVANQFIGYNELDVPLLFLFTASKEAINNYKGPKYIFYNKPNKGNIIINTGKTVAVAALDIAIKNNGEKIIFIGQDLAYLNDKSHSEGILEKYGLKNEVLINKSSKKVIGRNGQIMYTNKGYLLFKENIEKLIKDNNKIKFYNCSLGAEIKGAKFTTMKKLFEGDEIND